MSTSTTLRTMLQAVQEMNERRKRRLLNQRDVSTVELLESRRLLASVGISGGGGAVEGTGAPLTFAADISVPGYRPDKVVTWLVQWGDGGTYSVSPFNEDDNSDTITYAHGYSDEGNFVVTASAVINYFDDSDPSFDAFTTVSNTYTVTVSDASLSVVHNIDPLTVTEDQSFSASLGQFGDPWPEPGEYTATIHWGGSSTSPGTISSDGGGTFEVAGGHDYVKDSSYYVTVAVTDVGGATVNLNFEAIVVEGPPQACNCPSNSGGADKEPSVSEPVPAPVSTGFGAAAGSSAGVGPALRPSLSIDHTVQPGGMIKYKAPDGDADVGGDSDADDPPSTSGPINFVNNVPRLLRDNLDEQYGIVCGGNTIYFNNSGGTFTEYYGYGDTMIHDGTNTQYVLVTPDGMVTTFYDFSHGGLSGLIKGQSDPGGNTTSFTYDGSYNLTNEVTSDGSGNEQQYLFTYSSSLISNIKLQQSTDGGSSWATVSQVAYAYYGSSDGNGNVGDLKTATTEDGTGATIDTTYYRYWETGQTNSLSVGQPNNAIRLYLSGASFARAAGALSSVYSASDSDLKPYVDGYYEYDSAGNPALAIQQGSGCSSCSGGQGTFTYTYDFSSNTLGYNSWSEKATQSNPDGTYEYTYYNGYGQTMLDVTDDGAGTLWGTFTEYDSAGRPILVAQPSAVSLTGSLSTIETYSDLLHKVSSNYQYLNDSTGLIATTGYYSSTTANSTTPGGVVSYVEDTYVQQGETGTAIHQEHKTYFEFTGGGSTIDPIAVDTVYGATDGSDARATTYHYTVYPGTTQIRSEVVTNPTVSTGQNGPNTPDTQTTYFDTYGRPIWNVDGDGYITRTEYDMLTDGVTKTIQDWSSPYGSAAMSDQPLGYWRLGEKSGTVAADASGNGSNGTYSGSGVTLGQLGAVNADPDTAASFSTSGSVSFGTNTAFDLTSNISLECWFQLSGSTGADQVLMTTGDTSAKGFSLYVDTSYRLHGMINGVSDFAYSSALSLGTWYHAVLTRGASTTTLYLNGAVVGTSSSTPVNPSGQIKSAGASVQESSYYLKGELDEVSIYGSALSAARVRAHYLAGIPYSQIVESDGAAGYWRLDETADRYGIIHDYANPNLDGYGDGTIGVAGAIAGDSDTAMSFDGSTQYGLMNPDGDTALHFTGAATLEAWVKMDPSISSSAKFLVSSNQNNFWLGLHSGNICAAIDDGSGTHYADSGISASSVADTWVHVVGVYDGSSTLSVYVNGVLDGTVSSGEPANPSGNYIMFVGTNGSESGDFFKGSIDELAAYPLALTSDQILSHYNAGSGGQKVTGASDYANLVTADDPYAFWRLNETSGTTAADSSGNGHTGAYATNTLTLAQTGVLTADANTAVTFNGGWARSNFIFNSSSASVELWVKINSLPSSGFGFLAGCLQDSVNDKDLFVDPSGNVYWQVNDGTTVTVTGPTLSTGTWYHLVGTADGTTSKLYVNGSLYASTAAGATYASYTADNFMVSGTNQFLTAGVNAVIDEVALYNSALSSGAIAADYAARSSSTYAATVQSNSPYAYWRLGESSGLTVLDSSGNGRTGFYSGTYSLNQGGGVANDPDGAVGLTGGSVNSNFTFNSGTASIELWVKLNSLTPGNGSMLIAGCGTIKSDGAFDKDLYVDSSGDLYWYVWDGSGHYIEGPQLSVGKWYYIVGTADGTTAHMYVNGTESLNPVAAGSTYASYASNNFHVAGNETGADDGLNATVEDVALYTYALSQGQIETHYAAGINSTHLALTTIDKVDDLGRTTVETSPAGNVTYTVYNDTGHEVRVYPGWQTFNTVATGTGSTSTLVCTGLTGGTGAYIGQTLLITAGTDSGDQSVVTGWDPSTHTLTFSPAFGSATTTSSQFTVAGTTGPIQVSRQIYPGSDTGTPYFVETLTSSAAPHLDADGLPDGTETLDEDNIQSLERDIYNGGGQAVETDKYANMVGITYSTSSVYLGTRFFAPSDLVTGDSWSGVYGGQGAIIADGSSSNWPNSGTYTYLSGTPTMPSTTTSGGNTWWTSGTGSGANFTIDLNMTDSANTHQISLYLKDYGNAGRSERVDVLDSTGSTVLQTQTVSNFAAGVYLTFNVNGHVKIKFTNLAGSGLDAVLTGLFFDHAGNYYPTLQGYDHLGRPDKTVSPTGTITRTVYDAMGRVASTYVGTADIPASGYWSTSNNTSPSNMIDVQDNVYDGGSVGDGDLTEVTMHPGLSQADRVTDYLYDFRDRQVAEKDSVQVSEGSTTHRPIIYTTYDNLDEATRVYQYDGDGVSLSDFATTAATAALPTADKSDLRSLAVSSYDDQGRVYRSQVYEIDQSTGVSGMSDATMLALDNLETDTFYDHRGNVIATYSPGGQTSKSFYDGAGRVVSQFITDGGAVNNSNMPREDWTNAGSVFNDVVLEQTDYAYDADGNAILTTTRQRFDNDSTAAVGALGTPTSGIGARAYYVADHYDAADRLTDEVNYGTNGGNSAVDPGFVPARSDTVLVTHTAYDLAGNAYEITDPRGILTEYYFDMLGRTTSEIDNSDNGGPASGTAETLYSYDGDNNVLTMTAIVPGGTNQTTAYIYGVGGTIGTNLFSNDLISRVEYPTKTGTLAGVPSTASTDEVASTYDLLGEVLTKTDQNGNVHTYAYDVLGRLTLDAVTTLGSGVDGAVRALGYSYNGLGLPYQQTSYSNSAGSTVVNQVRDIYNGFGQLLTEYQDHATTVDPSTTPQVDYNYAIAAGASRLSSITYPDGRVLHYGYDNSALDNDLSRVDYLADDNAASGGEVGGHVQDYTYLGLDTIVQRADGNGVDLSYIQQSGDTLTSSDGGDQYTGLDRFGEVIDQNWVNTATSTSTDRFQYGYDQDGNVLYKNNLVSSTFSELYHANSSTSGDNATAYDNLDRLTGFRRGTLSASAHNSGGLDTVSTLNTSVTDATYSQSYTLDGVGNQTSVTSNGGSPDSRTVNSQNEATVVAGNTLVYDNNGNTTTDDQGHTLIYDAWNKQVEVKNGGTVLTTYTFDAQGRRIIENPGTATDLYFSSAGQVLEERQGSTVTAQNIWGLGYVNDLVLRDSFASAGALDTSFNSTGKETTTIGSGALAYTPLIQPDGKIVAVGINSTSGVLVRYNADGSLDTGFGSSGIATFSGVNFLDGALQSDGKIIAVGVTNSTGDFCAVRFNTDGSVDTSFGTSGETTIDFGAWDYAMGVAIQSDGKIVLAGATGSGSGSGTENWALTRLNSNGTIDTSFGTSGKTTLDWGADDVANGVVIQASGKIVLAGLANGGAGIARFTASGTLDTTFGTSGKIALASEYDYRTSIESLSDQRLLVTGVYGGDVVLHRYTVDGSADSTFGTSGTVTTDLGITDYGYAVAVQPDGKIVVAGGSFTDGTHADGLLVRYNADGSLDTTFNSTGKVLIHYGGSSQSELDYFKGVAIQKDGQIVAVGTAAGKFALARYNGGVTRLYAQQDANYNVTALVDVYGVVKQRYIYTPYGVMSVLDGSWGNSSESFGNVYTFQGGRVDPVTGMVHFGYREYSSSLGRWVQQDPAGYTASGFNLYWTFNDNPIVYSDPSGLSAITSPPPSGPPTFSGTTADGGSVSVFTGVTTTTAASGAIPGSIYIEFKSKSDCSKCHWIQIVRRDRYSNGKLHNLDSEGYPGKYTPTGGNLQFFGVPGLDTTKNGPLYYDQVGGSKTSAHEVTINDAPNTSDLFYTYKISFDDFLVCDDKLVYHLHWERWDGSYNPSKKSQYMNVGGGIPKGFHFNTLVDGTVMPWSGH